MQRRIQRHLSEVLFQLAVTIALGGGGLRADEPVTFNRDIRPILSDHCFQCHGPDRATRQADLRLDVEAEAKAERGGAPAIVAGKPDASELMARVTSTDSDLRMPPAELGRPLTAKQIALLRQWIEAGAGWEEHWSFQTPRRVDPPEVAHKQWSRHPIDRFVGAELERRGWELPPTASKRQLIRRLSQDLIGLPPTIEQVETFVADESPDAYDKLVARLLASPHYGERMAMQWLDAARYADSHGYSLDRRRVMWPWRDWVINAYNRNLAYDRFVIQQLAGDLLPDATVQQQLATGFNRNHPIQSEGGVINEEYRVETVVDRVETTSAVFLGLTMGCARCHDHKYESITQRDFYRFYAFFNNVPETAHVGNRDNQADRPTIKAPTRRQQRRKRELQSRLELLREQQRAQSEAEQASPASKLVETIWVDDSVPPGATSFGNGGGPSEFRFVAGPEHPVHGGKRASYRESDGLGQHGFSGAAEGLPIAATTRLFAYVHIDAANPPQQLMLQWNVDGRWEHRAYWGADRIPWGVDNTPSRKRMGDLPEAGKWVRLEVKAADVGIAAGKLVKGWAFTQFDGAVHWDIAGSVDIEPTGPAAERQKLQQQLDELDAQAPVVMVMGDMDSPRSTFILERGQYDRATDVRVEAGLPEALGTLPADEPATRLALARWLVSDANPLTARVAVNRIWQLHFGRGLVSTPEDFGTQGARPSHPELLDWLAVTFRESGWDVKQLHRLIVTSSAYRASSELTPALLERDPENVWLGRGPRLRLPAELIRDHALAVSGLLSPRLGGPSVRPYQPPGLWADVVYGNAPRFEQDHGEKLYRRSLYTYWKRSVPPPNLQTLDAPSREACTLQRSRTNTPLAALVLMNDPTFVESARVLASRAMRHSETPAERLRFMFVAVLGRPWTDAEAARVRGVWQELYDDYQQQPEQAKQLLSVGEHPQDSQWDPAEAAAYTGVANGLLSTDEAITRN